MFENLQEKLQRAFKSLRGQAVLTEENIADAMKQIRLALLEADVNFKVVKDLIDRIQAKAIGQDVLTALSPGEQVIKIVRDELVETLGKDTAKLKFASQPPTVVLMAGLQGSGKTTTSGKLANWLKNGGHRRCSSRSTFIAPPRASNSKLSQRRSRPTFTKARSVKRASKRTPRPSSVSPRKRAAKPSTVAATCSSSTPPAVSTLTTNSWTRCSRSNACSIRRKFYLLLTQ